MSQKASGYERLDGDRYYTPEWVTEALLSAETFGPGVYDPACGAGHICRALEAHRVGGVYGADVEPDGYGLEVDFFREDYPFSHLPNLITNPPYGKAGRLAVQFIERALQLSEPRRGKVAMLLRVDFDSANGRRPIFNDHPAFAAKYTLTKRIRWANLEQKASGPTENHAWFVWDWAKRRDAQRAYGYLP